MNLQEFLKNPAGKGDSSLGRAAIISTLDSKYNDLVKEKEIKCKIYRQLGSKSNYFIHLIIPSETERDNTYDVVFHLYKSKDNPSSKVKDYDVKFFTNTPSFAYTFLYVFYENGLFEESLKNKFDKEFFKDAPVVRNQFKVVNYDKYLYFGAKYVVESHLLSEGSLSLRSINYSEVLFNKTIRTFDQIMNEYRKAENKLKKKKNEEKKSKKDINSDRRNVSNGKVSIVQPKKPKTKKATKKKVSKVSKK